MKKILKISTLLFALMLIVSSCGQTEEEYAKAKDHNAAITDVTKAIEPNLNDAKAYVNGQDYGNSADAIKLCTVIQTNNFGTDAEAAEGLARSMSVIGASKRFVLQPCDNINNAVATSYKGIRYILYDRDFMSSLNSGDNWENLFILAHEVGHHINGHSLDLLSCISC